MKLSEELELALSEKTKKANHESIIDVLSKGMKEIIMYAEQEILNENGKLKHWLKGIGSYVRFVSKVTEVVISTIKAIKALK